MKNRSYGMVTVMICLLALPFWGVAEQASSFSRSVDASKGSRTINLNDFKSLYKKIVLAYGPWSAEELEVKNLRVYPSVVRVPAGAKIRFEPHPPANGRYIGRVTVPVTVYIDDKPVRRVQISGNVEVYKKVVCVKKAVKKGDILRRDVLVLTKRPMSRLHGEPFLNIDQVVGMELRRGLRSGQVIRARDIRRPLLVKRGQLVTIVAESSAIMITLPGRAQDSGAEGEVIRVKNTQSKKVLLAEVVGPKSVRVTF